MRIDKKIMLTCASLLLLACNQSNPGQNTTDAGTQQSTNTANSEMENVRTPADVDTVVSPGSNAKDIKGQESGSGTSAPNTQTKNAAPETPAK